MPSDVRARLPSEVGEQGSVLAETTDVDAVVHWCLDELGDELRALVVHTRATLDFLYIRDDVLGGYTDDDLMDMADAYGIEAVLGDSYRESLYDLGSLDYLVYGFEQSQVVRIPMAEYSAVFLSVERDASIHLPPFVESFLAETDVEFAE